MMSGIDSTLMHEPDIKLVAKISTADESLAAIDKFRPDVVLLKLRMSAASALDIIEMLRKAESKTRPVILAGRMTHEEFMRAMQLGVRGVFSTAMTASLLPRCLRVVHAGEEFIDRDVWRRTFEILARRPAAASAGILKLLTSREQSVAELAVSGWGNSQIARKLSITEGTVKVHLHRVYSKLEIKGRLGAGRTDQGQQSGLTSCSGSPGAPRLLSRQVQAVLYFLSAMSPCSTA
jgi:two-component system nitrate/nitrite response regulator NarP